MAGHGMLDIHAYPELEDLSDDIGARVRAGDVSHIAPVRIVTDVGILEPSPLDGELELVGIYPNVAVEDVKHKVGWPLRARANVDENDFRGIERPVSGDGRLPGERDQTPFAHRRHPSHHHSRTDHHDQSL